VLAGLDAGHAQRAKADDAGAQQRRGVQIVEPVVEGVREVRARDGFRRVAAIDIVAGKKRRIA
jgi:hypothetical protein